MKKFIITIVVLCIALVSNADYAKTETDLPQNTTEVSLQVIDLSRAENMLNDFLDKHELSPKQLSVSKTELHLVVQLERSMQDEMDSLLDQLGYTVEHKCNLIQIQDAILRLEKNTNLLIQEKSRYEHLVMAMDSSETDKYFMYWEKIISLESEIEKNHIDLELMNRRQVVVLYDVVVVEEQNVEMKYGNRWVNMPGIEYSLMWTENPAEGISPEMMQGWGLKYMFNRGKSYGLLSLYKSMDSNNPTEIDQTYMFAYGQDFYSRKLGRGQRRLFNLYTSINVGFYNSSTPGSSITSWFVNPFLGLELYKNKHILIDHKVGYFLPYKNNRFQRALLYNFSFNFVF